MTVKTKLVLTGLIVLAVAGVILFTPLQRYLFFGDRITGTVKVFLDGQPLSLESSQASDSADERNLSQGRFSCNGGVLTIKDRAGEYGSYGYTLDIPQCGRPIALHVFQFDWHQKTNFDCEIRLEKTAGGVKAECTAHFTEKNDNRVTKDTYEFGFDETEEIKITI